MIWPHDPQSTITNHHPLRYGGVPVVARPPRLGSRWAQWRRERACRRATHHCWHPEGMIDWWCCMCSADTDGMPRQLCTLCAAQTATFDEINEHVRHLDGTRRSRVALLTGLSPERLDELGGVGDDLPRHVNEVWTWPICTPEGDYAGGVWCADKDCPLQAENSEIGDFQTRTFTLADLHDAIGDHITKRREHQ